MANLKFSPTIRNSMLDILTANASSSATLTLYSGTQPGGGGAVTTQLAQLVGGATFAAAAGAGVLTVSTLVADTNADATGTATWFRLAEKTGANWCMDGDISTVAANTGDLQLDDTAIVLNGTVNLSGPNTITAPNAA